MAGNVAHRIPAVFYRTPGGNEVVLDWLRRLEDGERHAIGLDLMRVQYRWPVGMPLCRPLGNGLWEVRTSLPSGPIARMLFCVKDAMILVSTGFIKKTRKTLTEEIELARLRMKEFLP